MRAVLEFKNQDLTPVDPAVSLRRSVLVVGTGDVLRVGDERVVPVVTTSRVTETGLQLLTNEQDVSLSSLLGHLTLGKDRLEDGVDPLHRMSGRVVGDVPDTRVPSVADGLLVLALAAGAFVGRPKVLSAEEDGAVLDTVDEGAVDVVGIDPGVADDELVLVDVRRGLVLLDHPLVTTEAGDLPSTAPLILDVKSNRKLTSMNNDVIERLTNQPLIGLMLTFPDRLGLNHAISKSMGGKIGRTARSSSSTMISATGRKKNTNKISTVTIRRK